MLVMLIGIEGRLLFLLIFYVTLSLIDGAVLALLRVDAGSSVSFVDLWNLKGVSTGTRNSPLYRNGVIDNGFKSLCPSILEISHHNPFFNVMFKGDFYDSDLSSWLQTTPYYVRYYNFPSDVTSKLTPNEDIIHKVHRTGFPQKIFSAVYYPNNSQDFPIYYGSYQTPITGDLPAEGFKFYKNYKIEIWALYDDSCNLTDPNPPTSIKDAMTSIQLNNMETTFSQTTEHEQTTNEVTEPSSTSSSVPATSNEITEPSTTEQQLYTTTSLTGITNEITEPSTTEQQLHTTTSFTGTTNEITEPSTTEQQLYTTTSFTGTTNEITETSTTEKQLYTTTSFTGTTNEITETSTTEKQLYTTTSFTGTTNEITETSTTAQLFTITSPSGITMESETTTTIQGGEDNGCNSNPTEHVTGLFFKQTDPGHPTVTVSVNLWTYQYYSLVMCARACSLNMDLCTSFYYFKDNYRCTGLGHIENGLDRPTDGKHYILMKCT